MPRTGRWSELDLREVVWDEKLGRSVLKWPSSAVYDPLPDKDPADDAPLDDEDGHEDTFDEEDVPEDV